MHSTPTQASSIAMCQSSMPTSQVASLGRHQSSPQLPPSATLHYASGPQRKSAGLRAPELSGSDFDIAKTRNAAVDHCYKPNRPPGLARTWQANSSAHSFVQERRDERKSPPLRPESFPCHIERRVLSELETRSSCSERPMDIDVDQEEEARSVAPIGHERSKKRAEASQALIHDNGRIAPLACDLEAPTRPGTPVPYGDTRMELDWQQHQRFQPFDEHLVAAPMEAFWRESRTSNTDSSDASLCDGVHSLKDVWRALSIVQKSPHSSKVISPLNPVHQAASGPLRTQIQSALQARWEAQRWQPAFRTRQTQVREPRQRWRCDRVKTSLSRDSSHCYYCQRDSLRMRLLVLRLFEDPCAEWRISNKSPDYAPSIAEELRRSGDDADATWSPESPQMRDMDTFDEGPYDDDYAMDLF